MKKIKPLLTLLSLAMIASCGRESNTTAKTTTAQTTTAQATTVKPTTTATLIPALKDSMFADMADGYILSGYRTQKRFSNGENKYYRPEFIEIESNIEGSYIETFDSKRKADASKSSFEPVDYDKADCMVHAYLTASKEKQLINPSDKTSGTANILTRAYLQLDNTIKYNAMYHTENGVRTNYVFSETGFDSALFKHIKASDFTYNKFYKDIKKGEYAYNLTIDTENTASDSYKFATGLYQLFNVTSSADLMKTIVFITDGTSLKRIEGTVIEDSPATASTPYRDTFTFSFEIKEQGKGVKVNAVAPLTNTPDATLKAAFDRLTNSYNYTSNTHINMTLGSGKDTVTYVSDIREVIDLSQTSGSYSYTDNTVVEDTSESEAYQYVFDMSTGASKAYKKLGDSFYADGGYLTGNAPINPFRLAPEFFHKQQDGTFLFNRADYSDKSLSDVLSYFGASNYAMLALYSYQYNYSDYANFSLDTIKVTVDADEIKVIMNNGDVDVTVTYSNIGTSAVDSVNLLEECNLGWKDLVDSTSYNAATSIINEDILNTIPTLGGAYPNVSLYAQNSVVQFRYSLKDTSSSALTAAYNAFTAKLALDENWSVTPVDSNLYLTANYLEYFTVGSKNYTLSLQAGFTSKGQFIIVPTLKLAA